MLIGLIAAAAFGLVVLGTALAWALRQRRTHQKAFFELSKGILGIVAENKSIQPSLRPFLVQSMFFDHALRELQHSEARRIEAIRTLAQLDGLEVVAPLISQLSSDYRKVREEAVSALASLSEDAAIELLVSYWREDSNELLEEALLRRGPSIISKFGPIAAHTNPTLRVRSVEVLKQLRAPEAAAYLEDSILDSQATVRATAAFALGEIGSKNLKPLIGALKLDPATQVRLHAADSLMKIGGQEGLVALKDSFLNLGEHFLPADAATQLWKTLKRNLDQLECLEECLAATESMSAEAFRRWSKVGVTSGDVETLVLTAHYAPTRFDEIMNALSRATVIFGELTAVEQFVKGLALPGVSRSATLKALESLPISSSAFARLSSELQSIISDDPDEKVRLQALAILGRSNSISQEVASIKADKSVGEDGASTLRDEVRIRTVEQADLRNNESDRSENLYALVADENGPFRQQFRKYLEHEGIAVLGEVGTYMEMESILDQMPPETIVFCSASLPGCHMHLGQIEQKCAGRPIIFLAGAMRDDKSNESLEKHSSLVFVTRGGYQETVLEAVQQVGKGIKQEDLELS